MATAHDAETWICLPERIVKICCIRQKYCVKVPILKSSAFWLLIMTGSYIGIGCVMYTYHTNIGNSRRRFWVDRIHNKLSGFVMTQSFGRCLNIYGFGLVINNVTDDKTVGIRHKRSPCSKHQFVQDYFFKPCHSVRLLTLVRSQFVELKGC